MCMQGCACHTTTKIVIVVELQRFCGPSSWQMDNKCSLISCPDAPFFSHSLAFLPIITGYKSDSRIKVPIWDHSYAQCHKKNNSKSRPCPDLTGNISKGFFNYVQLSHLGGMGGLFVSLLLLFALIFVYLVGFVIV